MKTKLSLIAGLLFLSVIISMGTKPTSGTTSSENLPEVRVSTRARDQALQTDKFPRPPERVVSETAKPKTKY